MQAQRPAVLSLRNPVGWHLLVLVAVSVAYESLFIHHGIAWLFDEGWPLYAAMRLHAGGVLYADVFFPFPPGHLLPAWLAYALDPPGIILARIFYAGFNVVLCVAMYFLGRRVTTPTWALFGALLLAVAAPRSHLAHLLFGYRYLVFSVLALLAFAARLRSEETRASDRWMFAAGLAAGVALYFRLTPAFAVSCGIGLAVMTATRDPRRWLRDWVAYGLGLLAVALPILAWFAWTVGLDVLWREVVTRIIALQSAQSLPSPDFAWWPTSGKRSVVYRWFVAFQYRAYIATYAVYALVLLFLWLRSFAARRTFRHSLLLAIVVWGGLYLLRALGRSDDHHLMSAFPPTCLVLAHLSSEIGRGLARLAGERGPSRVLRVGAATAAAAVLLGGWVYAQRVDVFLDRGVRGSFPLQSTDGAISVASRATARRIDHVVNVIRKTTEPGDIVLDLSAGPLFHLLMERPGPGYIDVISPGIFLSEAEERAFVERLETTPPAAVIWPRVDFDRRSERSIRRTAPLVSEWVRSRYSEYDTIDRYAVLRPSAAGSNSGRPIVRGERDG